MQKLSDGLYMHCGQIRTTLIAHNRGALALRPNSKPLAVSNVINTPFIMNNRTKERLYLAKAMNKLTEEVNA